MAFSEEKANDAVRFIESLKHTKGRWAGVPFKLLSWQENEIIRPLFGTLKKNGKRQYRTCYVEVPKKQGKSELAAAIALKLLFADGEMGGEVYSAAGDREQASIVFNVAAQMVRQEPQLLKRCKIIDSRKRIAVHKTTSIYSALSSETYTKHGLNPSGIVCDETHSYPSRDLYDTLTEGTDIAREQQIVFIITTAGVADKTSIGWEIHDYARKVKEGIIDDPTFLPIIYAADEKEDWEDPEVWRNCNPSIDHIFDIENLRTHYKQVKDNPARLNNFLRFRLNRWVGQITRYIPMDKWDACDGEVNKGDLIKRACYGGLDLSTSVDLSAFVLVFPPVEDDEKWKILPHFYIPEERVMERVKRDSVSYDMWIRAGLITAVPGNTQGDYGFIRKDINNAAEIYNLKEVAFDPWGAGKIVTELEQYDGITMVEHRQGYISMSPPTKELLNYTLAGKLAHSGNPVLRWNIDNLAVKIDASENVRPMKDESADRIDGAVALVMALGRAIKNFDKTSVYGKDRGLITL